MIYKDLDMKSVKKDIDYDLKVKNLKPKYWSIIRYHDKEMIIIKYGDLRYDGVCGSEYTTCGDAVYLGVWKYGEITKENILKHAKSIKWQAKIRKEDIKECEVLFLM